MAPITRWLRPLCCALLLLPAIAADKPDPVPAPADWRREDLPFPLEFAPDLPYQGTVHLRFSPNWAKHQDPEGYGYVTLWQVKPTGAYTVERLRDELGRYYTGLMRAVAKDKGQPQPADTKVTLAREGEDFFGRMDTVNAFSKGEPMRVQVEVRLLECKAGPSQGVALVIGRAERSSAAWQALRQVRDGIRC
jgi:hypothetical protein